MIIKNKTEIKVSWFCFNERDAVKLVALGSGNISHRTGLNQKTYNPPKNSNKLYYLRYTEKGGGKVLGAHLLTNKDTIVISGRKGKYTTEVIKGS